MAFLDQGMGFLLALIILKKYSGFFYTNQLNGLSFNIVNKNDAEVTKQQLNALHPEEYEFSVSQAQQFQARAAAILERLSALPAFDLESPYRYKIDLFGGGKLYDLRVDNQPQLVVNSALIIMILQYHS